MRSHNFKLHPVDAVEAVDEEDEDEDKGNLHPVLYFGDQRALGDEAIVISSARGPKHIGRCWASYVKILRLMLNGRGISNSINMAISAIRRPNTLCLVSPSKHASLFI